MVFVVAEIGVNWNGDFQLVEEMMIEAKKSDCNAVKFQCFNEDILGTNPLKNELMNSSISKSNIEEINSIAKKVNIEWFCTPMYSDAVDLLDPFVNKFKIRIGDSIPILKNKKTKLFEKVLRTNKDIIISSEISPQSCDYFENKKISWLYGVPKYPCTLNDLDTSNFKYFDGYSNHHPHFIAPLTFSILGANIIEIHITSDKSKDFVDNPVSFDYVELKQLVKLIRMSENIHC
jgi:N,N'-diacetyllegionaminate synthase